jgi:death on curing protein
MEYLIKEDVVLINHETVKEHGGNFIPPYNFLHEENLDYLLEAVQAEMFGAPLYPEISDKAGLYLFNIIANHIFQDGNKRTGLQSMLTFLQINNYNIVDSLCQVEIENGILLPSDPTNEIIKGFGVDPNEVIEHNSKIILFNFITEIASGMHNLKDCQTWIAANIERIYL